MKKGARPDGRRLVVISDPARNHSPLLTLSTFKFAVLARQLSITTPASSNLAAIHSLSLYYTSLPSSHSLCSTPAQRSARPFSHGRVRYNFPSGSENHDLAAGLTHELCVRRFPGLRFTSKVRPFRQHAYADFTRESYSTILRVA